MSKRCGWSVIDGCQGNGQGGFCSICAAGIAEDEHRKTHCCQCGVKCTDTNSCDYSGHGTLTRWCAQCEIASGTYFDKRRGEATKETVKYVKEKAARAQEFLDQQAGIRVKPVLTSTASLPSNVIPFRRRET